MKKLLLSVMAALAITTAYAEDESPKYEVRAVWLETIDNLDWPSTTGEAAQKEELCNILDQLAAANFNTILFQAQGRGDVAWVSDIQPAMYEFTKNYAASLPYDVAQFVIDECHKRNMECHATIIPYRLGPKYRANGYAQNKGRHPYLSHPELCVTYSSQLYLDPGNPATTEYLVDLYRELLSKYDFDGVSFDYCRYPGSDFDDAASYAAYNPEALPKSDWRRKNINDFIAAFYEMVQEVNPKVKVGAAPIGTYKNLPGYGNATAYGSYYQDACQWCQSGNCHTLYPQMYWNETYGFTPNMGTWVNNMAGCQFVVGLAPYKMLDSNAWEPSVITDQIEKVRRQDGAHGVCFFRTQNILPAQGTKQAALYNELKDTYFNYPAHIPPMEYKIVTTPNSPRISAATYNDGELTLSWDAPSPDAYETPIKYYCVYRLVDGVLNANDIRTAVEAKVNTTSVVISDVAEGDIFAITAFDYNNYESAPTITASVDGVEVDRQAVIVKDGTTLKIISQSDIVSARIYNVGGKLVYSSTQAASEVSIDISSLSNGVYIIKVETAGGEEIVDKFVR